MSRVYGVVTAVVTDVNDPDGQGRVRVRYPWLGDQSDGYWAPVATLMAGGNRGSWYMPELNDEVLVAFDHGDVTHPFIVGFLWNGQDTPPSTDPHLRLIRTVNGHEIAIYDPPVQGGDQGYIQIKYARGDMIEISNSAITIQGFSAVVIQAPTVTINGRPVLPAGAPI